VAGGAALIGLMHGDVQPAVADRQARGREAPAVAQLGEDRHRAKLADPVVAHQRPTADLAASVATQRQVQRGDLHLERVDHQQRDRDLLTRGLGQRGGSDGDDRGEEKCWLGAAADSGPGTLDER
jgi:hypothetical protein